MVTLVFSYNKNDSGEYFIMPSEGPTPGAMVKGFEGCVDYILGCLIPVEIEISSVEGENYITKAQENTLKRVAKINNKVKNIERILRR